MMGNIYHQPDKLIDERQIAALAIEHSTLSSMTIAAGAFAGAIETLKAQGEKTAFFAADQWTFRQAIAAVFDAGRVQGMREERAKRRANA